jgi:hypothetical protein
MVKSIHPQQHLGRVQVAGVLAPSQQRGQLLASRAEQPDRPAPATQVKDPATRCWLRP